MIFDPNPLFYKMASIFSDNYSEDKKVVICNEGGTRSSKTWDTFHFLYAYCDHNRNKGKDIYILRNTLKNCRDKTFKDFKKCISMITEKKHVGITYLSENQSPKVTMFGNNIYFEGLDKEDNAEGYPSDVLFINEALETEQDQISGLKMRCRELIIMDWNPKFTDHWCFNLEDQDNTFFTHTNYKNNKHLKKSIINEIESYEPWESGSYEIRDNNLFYNNKPISDDNQPPVNKRNLETGTIDEFRWKVYGLGLRGAMKGVIYSNVIWIDEFPKIAHTWGMDFGFTADPTTLVKYAREGRNIYLELFLYQPIDNSKELDAILNRLGVSKYVPITADSSDRYVSEKKGVVRMVSDLYEYGWEISKVSKNKAKVYRIQDIKSHRIHIVKKKMYNPLNGKTENIFKKEQENYIWKQINGIAINQPIDGYDHAWDATLYAHASHEINNLEVEYN